jgi:hypothetical protein
MRKFYNKVLKVEYSILNWNTDTDMIRISYLMDGKFVSRNRHRETWENAGFAFDKRMFNGGSRENSGRPEKSEDEKMVAFSMTDHPEIIKGFGGLDQYRIAVRQFTKEHTNL